MSLGNALPTETTTATVDSCSVLQTKTNERGKSGQRAAFYSENGSFRNVSGDSSSENQKEIQHCNSDDISQQQSHFSTPRHNMKHNYITLATYNL